MVLLFKHAACTLASCYMCMLFWM